MSTVTGSRSERRITEVTNKTASLRIDDQGPIRGPVVVLLHGFPKDAATWSATRNALHGMGFCTLDFKQRGYEPRAQPRGRWAYRMTALASDVVAVLTRFRPAQVSLVGHDCGASVAWSVAARHPELVRSLTTVSVPHRSAFARSLFTSDQARRYYMAVFQIPWLPEYAARRRPDLARLILLQTRMSPVEADRVVNEFVPTWALTGGLNWCRAIALSHRGYTQAIAVPTTHVWPRYDHVLARSAAELCSRHVSADYRLDVLDGSHWILDEHPATLARIIAALVTSTFP
uniref:alpha/beta fold hydrolase n=1 Tax=Rhodococcus qingshengii TaxID=334542 RepID=UPI001C4DFD7C|nr:alpha/beta hydrolase [Rhodococcus qingshengii]